MPAHTTRLMMTDRTRTFIASSSEVIEEADSLQVLLAQKGLLAETWKQSSIFSNGEATWESLADKVHEFDFAILLLTPDDLVKKRGKKSRNPRDNVVLEAGLFTGALGRKRVFYVRPEDIDELELPVDLLGIKNYAYRSADVEVNPLTALASIATQIARAIKQAGPRSVTSIGDLTPDRIESMFSLTAMTTAYPNREEAKKDMFRDIAKAKVSVRLYARVYLSEIVKDTHQFATSIKKAVANAKGQLLLRSTANNHSSDVVVDRLYQLEDPKRRRWKSREAYLNHLAQADGSIEHLASEIADEVGPKSGRKRIRFEKRVVNEIFPHSMLVIDESLVYVSFYRLSHTTFGTHSPTLRLVNEPNRLDWADTFLREAAQIDKALSTALCEPRTI